MDISIITKTTNIRWRDSKEIWVKDESECPTGTFKDRLALRIAQRIEKYPDPTSWTVSAITLGNTIISIANILSRALPEDNRPKIIGIFPHDFDARTIGPDNKGITERGEHVIRRAIKHDVSCIKVNLYSEFLDEIKIKELIRAHGFSSDNLIDVSQGLDVPSYQTILEEAIAQIGLDFSKVFVPVGAGVLFDEFVSFIEKNRLNITVYGATTTNPKSIADKIYSYYSKYHHDLITYGQACSEINPRHKIFSFSDEDIMDSLANIPKIFNAEPSAAAAFCLINREDILQKYDNVLVINTGNGIVGS